MPRVAGDILYKLGKVLIREPLPLYEVVERKEAMYLYKHERLWCPVSQSSMCSMCATIGRIREYGSAQSSVSMGGLAGLNQQQLCRHVSRLQDYLWIAEDGMKMAGYNGSQLWDTAFTVQAYIAASVDTEASTEALRKAHAYIQVTQVWNVRSLCTPGAFGAVRCIISQHISNCVRLA